MAYNYWKMMDKVGVAVRSYKPEKWRGREQFDGYIFEPSDKSSREKAIGWATQYDNRWDNDKETIVYEPNVHEFENEGFTITILDSAGGSSQGGRLSFWKCRVEKDGVEFVVGVNDAILADLIRNSDIEQGKVKQKLMFARRGGQPGFIHEGMEAYEEAVADMKKKADMKSMKKTSKWELGGVYSSVTMTDVCLGQIWDTEEEVPDSDYRGWYPRTKMVKREKPVQVTAWLHVNASDEPLPETFKELIEKELKDTYIYFTAGKPPARAKTRQLTLDEDAEELRKKFFGKVARIYAERYKELPRYVLKP